MRTTVTLDPDVEARLRDRMRERGISFKQVLNEALRAALTDVASASGTPYELLTYRMGFRPEIALDKALSLAAAAEDEEIARKLSLRK
jgi:hypothetical protein